jgi:hypothetical protein
MCSNRQGYIDYNIYRELVERPICESYTWPFQNTSIDRFNLAHVIPPQAIPQTVNFNENPQDLNGLQFVLPDVTNRAENLDLMLSTVPTALDRKQLFTRDVTARDAQRDFTNSSKTHIPS